MAAHYAQFPYPQFKTLYRTLRPPNTVRRPAVGRWHRIREKPGEEQLTKDERAALDRLRTLGYVSGSQPSEAVGGVSTHDSDLAYDGLNLWTDGQSPSAVLADMQGAIYDGVALVKINAESELVWSYDRSPHHDLEVTEDGLIYVLAREAEMRAREDLSRPGWPLGAQQPILHDFVVILDQDGAELRRISLLDAIRASPYSDLLWRMDPSGDLMHTNTLELLDGSLEDRVPSFKSGNVLVSIRETNTIAVLDIASETIVWAMSGPWIAQHQPTVLRNGNILVFDNLGAKGRSRVLEFDPLTQEIVWSLDGFFSATIGSTQRLPNGNTLITESSAGRAIEVTPSRQVVWEFTTPNRAGENDLFIANLFELQRLDQDFPLEWAK
jgi:hypothetical protein